ncbi:MAG TPA: SDR family NAD(P)-dependent oxidoreductase [Dehalococcoidia bacterium]|nr:SDR family NAD(P)-dependent oxidoreductase [Dehalococcoidia bacterium]
MKVRGRTAIVTGASSGIGLATARRLARAGANVVLLAREPERLQAAASTISNLPVRSLAIPLDMADRAGVFAAVERALEAFGSVDILVNNAGLGLSASIADGKTENMRRVFDVNFFGYINAIQAVVPPMRRQGRGVIVNVSSVTGRIPTPFNGVYAASKAAIAAMSDALRLELKGGGISVLTVYPGFTRTDFSRNSLREIGLPARSPLLRGVSPDLVAAKIIGGIRRPKAEIYITFGDRLGIFLKNTAPGLVDWGIQHIWLGGRTPRELDS